MSGIGTEIRVFCYAILTGVLIVAVYLWIRVLRRLVAHRLWLINLEDACYWAGISVYTFVQIYHTRCSAGVYRTGDCARSNRDGAAFSCLCKSLQKDFYTNL